MAKGKPTGEAPRPARSTTTRIKREKEQPENDGNPPPREDSQDDTPNPEWWRGDPGRRGEVL